MKNRIITLVVLLLSLVSSLYGTQNFLQMLSDENLKNFTPDAMAQMIDSDTSLLNHVGDGGNTPLFTAIQRQRFDLACKLIELNAETKIQNANNYTPLDEIVIYLCGDVTPDKFCENLVQQLLQKKLQVNPVQVETMVKTRRNLNEKQREIISLIIQAITDKNLINKPIEFFVDKQSKGKASAKKQMSTLLHWTIQQNMTQSVAALLVQGADVTLVDSSNNTALQHTLKLLAQSDFTKKNKSLFDIIFLLWNDHEKSYDEENIPLLDAMLSIKALPSINDVDDSVLIKNFTNMVSVCIDKVNLKSEKYKNILNGVIEAGFRLNTSNQFNHWIIFLKKIIQKNHLNVNFKMKLGTSVHFLIDAFKQLSDKQWFKKNAFIDQIIDVFKELLKKNPDLSISNASNQNPLHYAVSLYEQFSEKIYKEKFLKIIPMLVEHGSPIKDALDFLLDEESKIKTDKVVKQQLWEVIKTIIQAVSANNNDQLNELKANDMSIHVINLAGAHDDIDFLKLLEKYNIDFKNKKITRDKFTKDFNQALGVSDDSSKQEPSKDPVKNPVQGPLPDARKGRPLGARGRKRPTRKPPRAQDDQKEQERLKQEKEEQENLARKQNLDERVEILEKLRKLLKTCFTEMNSANTPMAITKIRINFNRALDVLKKEVKAQGVEDLFPGKLLSDLFGDIDSKEKAADALVVTKNRKDELLSEIAAIPLTEKQKEAEVERLKEKAEKEQADKKAQEEVAKIKAQEEAAKKAARLAADQEKKRDLEVKKLDKLKKSIDAIIGFYNDQTLKSFTKTTNLSKGRAKFAELLTDTNPLFTQPVIKALEIPEKSEQAEIEKIQSLIVGMISKMQSFEMDLIAALSEVQGDLKQGNKSVKANAEQEKLAQEKAEKEAKEAEAEKIAEEKAEQEKLAQEKEAKEVKEAQEAKKAKKAKKSSGLESALKSLKDRLNGLRGKLKILREQLTNLKDALSVPVK